MATKGDNQKTRVATPNVTKNGKQRLGPLTVTQLTELVTKTSKPKEKAKILRRIAELQSRKGYIKPVEAVVEEIIEAITE